MLREVNNLSQATQLTSNRQNWHWNSNLPGFKSHALSMTPQNSGWSCSFSSLPSMCALRQVI